MAMGIVNWLGKKIGSEVHKSKIDEFEKRILEIEKKQEVILKTITDNTSSIDKMDKKVYDATLESAKISGALETLRELYKSKAPQDEK